jgi:hypothetical protein
MKGEVLCPTCGHWQTPEQHKASREKLRYKRMCSGKGRFENVIAALVAAHEIYRNLRDSMWPYLCEFGGDKHWHLGHHKAQMILSRVAGNDSENKGREAARP